MICLGCLEDLHWLFQFITATIDHFRWTMRVWAHRRLISPSGERSLRDIDISGVRKHSKSDINGVPMDLLDFLTYIASYLRFSMVFKFELIHKRDLNMICIAVRSFPLAWFEKSGCPIFLRKLDAISLKSHNVIWLYSKILSDSWILDYIT